MGDHHDHEHRIFEAHVARRRFIEMVAVGAGGAFLAACAPGAVPAAPSTTAANLLAGATWYGQSAFGWKSGAKVIYVDPGSWLKGKNAPPADLILFTHMHGDHFVKDDLAAISGPKTTFVAPADVAAALSGDVKTVKPGDSLDASGIKIQAVPAYNARDNAPHPQSKNWVGYLVELGGKTYYHAGDTDDLPQLRSIKADAAFVPIGGFFTMGVDEAAALVKAIKPKVALPMHFGYVSVPAGGLGPGSAPVAVGVPADAEKFKAAASPVEVTLLNPVNPFTNK